MKVRAEERLPGHVHACSTAMDLAHIYRVLYCVPILASYTAVIAPHSLDAMQLPSVVACTCLQCPLAISRWQVPYAQRVVTAAAHHGLPIRGEGDTADNVGVTLCASSASKM